MTLTDVPAYHRTIEREETDNAVLCFNGLYIVNPQNQCFQTITRNHSNIHALKLEKIFSQALFDLNDYYNLTPGWDGYSGKQIDASSIELAKQVSKTIFSFFKNNMFEVAEITPGPVADGTIDLEIKYGEKHLILNISGPKKLFSIFKEDSYESLEYAREISSKNLAEELNWFNCEVLGEIQLA